MVARRAHNPEVVGSNPIPATTKTYQQSLVFFGLNFLMRYVIFSCVVCNIFGCFDYFVKI